MRTKAEKRKNDYNKALKKKRICERHYGFEYYDNIHQYSKNKIHCSCPICSSKTNGKGRWGKGKNLTHSDKIKIDCMNSQLEDIYMGE